MADHDSWALAVGSVLGKYTISGRLGMGMSSIVYRARDTERDASVALKVIALQPSAISIVQRFLREMRVYLRLNHPHIVRVTESGLIGDYLYIAMDIHGKTLRSRLDLQGTLLPKSACAYAVQICAALDHAHAQGVIHRDIKPANILSGTQDTNFFLLTDFGIARMVDDPRITRTNTTVGSPNYLAPEQAIGSEVSPATDIYALGCVLFEMMTGRPPFQGRSIAEIIMHHVGTPPKLANEYEPSIPLELAQIIDRMLAKKPSDRYRSARVLGGMLAPFAE